MIVFTTSTTVLEPCTLIPSGLLPTIVQLIIKAEELPLLLATLIPPPSPELLSFP